MSTQTDLDWQNAAALDAALERRRLQLDLEWKDVAARAELSTQALRDIRNGASRPRARTIRRLELAVQWEPGSVRRVLGGGEPILMEDQPPQPGPPPEPLASRNPEDLEWDGELRGEPHLRSGEVLRWRRQPDGDIRYVLSRVTDGETESVWYTFSPERTIGFVVQYFREQLDKYSLDKIDKAGHRGA